jgi:hypothetical protein
MSVAFLERSIQSINGKLISLKNYTNATILSAINQMSSAISIVANSVSAVDARVTTLENTVVVHPVPVATVTTSVAISSTIHIVDEASIWTDGADGTIVRLVGDNQTFSTLLLPTEQAVGKYYVLTNTSATHSHHIHINDVATTIYTLQPLETATLIYTASGWIGLMGIVPKVEVSVTHEVPAEPEPEPAPEEPAP